MIVLVTIIHVIACFILVLTVLLQAGKGADIGAVFGGASTTIFGSSGAGNFLTRLTTGAAIVFMATSLTLTYGSSHHTGSIMPESAAPPVRNEPLAGGVAEEGEPIAPDDAGDGAAAPAAEAPDEAPAAAPAAPPAPAAP